MVLAAPGPLLTPPPSSSPPKTPHRSYSAQTRSQNEEKNLPPKPYLPLQTRTRHRQSHRPHVPMLMRGTPPTMRSPPHQSRPTENPPNLQPATVGEEERGGRDPTSRRTSMRAASELQAVTDRSACVAAPHRTSHPPQQKDAVHSCAPARGRWPAPAQDRCAAPHGRMRATPVIRLRRPPPRHRSPTRHVPRQQQQGLRKGGHPVVSNRPLHRAMQQRRHHASASAPSPSWPPMPRSRLQRAATARREKVQLCIREQSFFIYVFLGADPMRFDGLRPAPLLRSA